MSAVDLRANAPQLRLTATSAVASLLATLTLTPVFVGRHWLGESVLAIAVIAIVGAAGRLVRLPRVPVVALQLVALLMLLTYRFVPEDATAGFIPSGASLGALVDLAKDGATSINQQIVPVVDVPGITFLVVLGIGLAALEIDLSAVACRCPAIAGIVVLAIYGVSIAVLPFGASWWWFTVGTAGWLLLLYVGRREAVREWGDTLLDSGGSRWFGTGDPRAALAWQVGLGAVVAAVLVAGLVPGVGDGVIGRVTDIGGGSNATASTVRLDLTATIKRNLQSKKDTPLLKYRAGDGSPQYLRLAVLDRFAGVAWQPAALPENSPSTADGEQDLLGLTRDDPAANFLSTDVQSFGAARDLAYLPAPYTPVQYSGIGSEWVWDTSTATAFSRSSRLGAAEYAVESEYVPPVAKQLASTSGSTTVPASERIVPEGLPASLTSTAADAVAGATTDYAKAVRLQGYFRNNYRYSLGAPPTDTGSAIQAFLTTKVGYCQQFAATYALMARSLGLASRVVVGFTPGTPSGGGWYTVGTKDYHAWPEVWFDHVGWVRFEPTPRADSGSRIDVPDWSLPNKYAPPTIPKSATQSGETPAPAPSTSVTRQPRADGVASVTTSTSWSHRLKPVGIGAIAVMIVALAIAPGVARASRRRRRLGRNGSPLTAASIEAAWDELADTARDLGVPWTEDDTPRRTADALVHAASLDAGAAGAVQSLRRDVELARYAGRPNDAGADGLPADSVRTVRRSLLAGSTRADRLRAALTPRTVFKRSSRKLDP